MYKSRTSDTLMSRYKGASLSRERSGMGRACMVSSNQKSLCVKEPRGTSDDSGNVSESGQKWHQSHIMPAPSKVVAFASGLRGNTCFSLPTSASSDHGQEAPCLESST